MPGQHHEKFARIAAHHLHQLKQIEQFVIVAHYHNWPTDRVAKVTGYAVRTVEDTAKHVYELIAYPLGYGRKGLLAGVWASLHGECCLPQGWEAFKEAIA